MKRSVAAVVGLVLGLLTMVAGLASPASAAPYCGIRWGSLAKSTSEPSTGATLVNVRSGRHACFDRLVLDASGDAGGYVVEYTDEVRQDGSGFVVPLRGGAKLSIVTTTPGHDLDYRATYSPADQAEVVDVSGYRTFRQVAYAGTYEGNAQIGVGVRARLPFRVFELAGPGGGSRIVLDVAHRW